MDSLQNVFEYGEKKGVSKVYTPGGLPEVELMDRLTVFNHDGRLVVDSRQVAEMVGKEHKNLLQDIRGYIAHFAELKSQPSKNDSKYVQMAREMFERTHGNIDKAISDFFIPHTYRDSTGRTLPCYLLTRKGCDMVANKMTGEKGVLFTAAYVTKFEEMERQLIQPQSIEDLIIMQAQSMKQLKAEVAAQGEQIQTIKETLIEVDEDWRRDINLKLNRIAYKRGGGQEYSNIKVMSYDILEERAHCDLATRLRNLRTRLELRGETQTKINNVNYLDVIEADPRIKEIYTTIVKELAIKYLT